MNFHHYHGWFQRPCSRIFAKVAGLGCLLSMLWLPLVSMADSSLPGVNEPFIGWQSPFFGAGIGGSSNTNFIPGVYAQAIWDDGRGPALYAGGNFVTMNDVYSPGIARWDGTNWEPVHLLDDPDREFSFTAWSMIEFQGDLIVAGTFFELDGQPVRNILRYDGQAWHPLTGSKGTGIGGQIRSLAVFQDELIVGGDFSQAGGLAVNGIARWTGTDWQTLPNPFQSNANFRALTVFQGELVAGGSLVASAPAISRVARWDGASWMPLAGPSGEGVSQDPGFGVQVNALLPMADDLIVGGRFASAGGIAARNVARWDGSQWAAFDIGLGGVTDYVSALEAQDETLFVGGGFPGSGTIDSPNIIGWDGSQWFALEGPNGAGAGLDIVMSLAAFDQQLYLGGLFSQAGGVLSRSFARWTGSSFERVVSGPVTGPMGGNVESALIFDKKLIIGGSFTETGESANLRIAAWDGTAWQAMSGGFAQGAVNALVEFEGELIAGGSFTFASDPDAPPGRTVNRVARWDGSAWQAMANGFNGGVQALHVHLGQLYAAGTFTAAGSFGGAPLAHIARWNGSDWEAVDAGLGGGVWSLHSHDGELVAGGAFTSLGNDDPAQRVAVWNAKDGWRALGAELTTGLVRTAVSFQGELYVGGSFGAPPLGVSPRFLARWDGETWQAVTRGVDDELSWQVHHLAATGQDLYIGGAFDRIGTFDLHCVARYSPDQGWRRMSGPNGIGMRRICSGPNQLIILEQAVVAVGVFGVAGGQVAHQIGYWSLLEDSLFQDRFQTWP